jgi:hypothetical protein
MLVTYSMKTDSHVTVGYRLFTDCEKACDESDTLYRNLMMSRRLLKR